MKIFLSAIEASPDSRSIADSVEMKWILMSYYYLRNNEDFGQLVQRKAENILIDSGAHSFQKGVKVDWLEYTKKYADFIKRFDTDKVLGYFEMDVDNIIGYDRVLELRKILESVSDKIIPVWHKNRGIENYKQMCRDYSGKVVAITGFKNEDIKDEQYLLFLKYAHQHNCKVHCLGMTRKKVLDRVPFDFVDSSSWKQEAIYGRVGDKRVSRDFSKTNRIDVFRATYLEGVKMQKHYQLKWRKY